MSKIFEALQLSGSDFAEKPAAIAPGPTQPVPRSFSDKLMALYRRIETTIECDGGKVVSIAGLQSTEQSFTYAFELARMASTQLKLRVLLLCSHQSGCQQFILRDPQLAHGWESVVFDGAPVSEVIHRLTSPSISVSQLNATPESLAGIVTSPLFRPVLRALRSEYDLIVIDTQPFSEGVDAVLVSEVADGSVLVVDAGVTRWQVIRKAVEQIESQNGTLLGVVLNKRRHYIPNFIYRRL
ncbi:MAG: hypothetical protein AMXMBFR84_21730 [Candidatus Hydrogenedentota bacterium]